MITQSSEKTLQQSESFTSHSFGIKESGLSHIFNVLRNQLYSNKTLAVIREYSCNAYDAHIEVGKKDTPIKITIPNQLEPHFKVRDYGRGLTEKEISEVYAMYGESTKRGTNEQIGQLGLGCKSAFAYGDNFIINSFVDGERISYNAFIDPSEIGQITKMDTQKTDEENGIEIVIPVKQDDYEVFASTATDFFKYWVIVPQFEGLDEESLKENMEVDVTISGNDWYSDSKANASFAIMGNICYPISSYNLNFEGYEDNRKQLLEAGVIINFPIGSLEISASREQLQYTERTKDALLEKLKGMVKELPDVLSGALKDCKTYWDAKIIYNELFYSRGSLYALKDIIKKTGVSYIDQNGKKWQMKHNHFDSSKYGEDIKIWVYRKPDQWARGKRVRGQESHNIVVDKKALVVEDDCDTHFGRLNRIAPLIENYEGEPKDHKKHDIIYLIKYLTPNAKKNFNSEKGFDFPCEKLSSYPKIVLRDIYPSNSTVAGGTTSYKNDKHSTKVFELDLDSNINSTYHTCRSDLFSAASVDFDKESGIYVKIDKFFVWNKGEVHPVKLKDLLNGLKKIGVDVPTVYAIKANKIDKTNVAKSDNWIEAHDWAKEVLIKHIKSSKITQKVADAYYYEVFSAHLNTKRDWAHEMIEGSNSDNRKVLSGFVIDKDSPLKKMLKASASMLKKKDAAEKVDKVEMSLYLVRELCGLSKMDGRNHWNGDYSDEAIQKRFDFNIQKGIDLFKVEPSFNLDDLSYNVEQRYPLFKLIDNHLFHSYKWDDNFSSELANYANIIDITFASKKKV
jgi:hypothetical protein